LIVLAAALAACVRNGVLGDDRALRFAGVAAAAGAATGAIEMIPHLLAGAEASEFRSGDSSPASDLHLVLQVVATPALGFGIATLALVAARRHALGSPLAAVLGVAGGIAYGMAGPALSLLKDPSVAPLFIGAQAIALWLLVAGYALVRSGGLLRGAEARASG